MTCDIRSAKRWLPAAFLGIVVLLAACGGGTDPSCAVQSVTVTPNPASLSIGETITFTATIASTNCSSAPAITWSTAPAVSVTPNGATADILGVSATAGAVAVTATAKGVSGSSQVTVNALPSLSLSAAALNFSATEGAANPASQFITISNGGGGALTGLATGTITYGAGATGWLQAPNFNTTTAPANLTLQPVTGSLAPGVYTATIPVQSPVATNSPQTLTVNFTIASNQSVAVFAGDLQTGLVGVALNVRPAVRVTSLGVPVSGVGVTFFAATGGGGITGNATVNTDGNGVAQVGGWVLGAAPGGNTLTATVAGAGVINNPITFSAIGAAPAFNITIQNIGPPFSGPVQTAFNSAVAKWQQIIYQDLPDIAFNVNPLPAATCSDAQPLFNGTVDDVLIFAQIDSIDGPGTILGQAGPCIIRTTGRLTIVGVMTFDSADVAGLVNNGSLNAVILHEMGHVLGFGSLWTQVQFDCLENPSNPPGTITDAFFDCTNGRVMFDSIGGTSYTGVNKVPVEDCSVASPVGCGAGTVNSHWREPTFVNELMTGYLNAGSNPLSRLTAASLQDLGYGVNYAGADVYVHTFTLRGGAASGSMLSFGDDRYKGPLSVVDQNGRLVRVIRPR